MEFSLREKLSHFGLNFLINLHVSLDLNLRLLINPSLHPFDDPLLVITILDSYLKRLLPGLLLLEQIKPPLEVSHPSL